MVRLLPIINLTCLSHLISVFLQDSLMSCIGLKIYLTLRKKKYIQYLYISKFCLLPYNLDYMIKQVPKKIECIQERALRFMFNDYCSTYPALLEKCNYTTLHVRRIKTIACEVFKSINKLNPIFMHNIFKTKDLSYQLRDNHTVYQPKFKDITYVRHIFAYHGSQIWNTLPNQVKESTDIISFKRLLKTWEGFKCQSNMCDVLN